MLEQLIVCVFVYVVIVAIAYCPGHHVVESVACEPVDYFPEPVEEPNEPFDMEAYLATISQEDTCDDGTYGEVGSEEVTIDWWLTMTKKELMSIARNRGLTGYSRMKKYDLAIALHGLPLVDSAY